MPEPAAEAEFAISHVSLVAAAELEIQQGGIVSQLAAMAAAGRLVTVPSVVDAVKDRAVIEEIASAAPNWVVPYSYGALGTSLGEVYDICGTELLNLQPNPNREPPEPWLLALARLTNCAVVYETGSIIDLEPYCEQLGLQIVRVETLI